MDICNVMLYINIPNDNNQRTKICQQNSTNLTGIESDTFQIPENEITYISNLSFFFNSDYMIMNLKYYSLYLNGTFIFTVVNYHSY